MLYSSDYATLQAAINDAKARARPLTISPGVHTLTEPLVLDDCDRLHVFAYRASLVAGANMAAIVDMKNCTRCSWQGGWLKVPTGVTVDNALYVYHDTSQCTHNSFRDVVVEGDYSAGIRVGQMGSSFQCDHMYFANIECLGRALSGQVGIHVGTGVYGNCLNHTFRNIMCSGHDTHIVVDATNAYFDGLFLDRATVDIQATTTTLSVRNVRSEESARFLVTGGPASYPTLLSFEHIQWYGAALAVDGEWIQTHLAGLLRLRDIDLRNAAVAPKIAASLAAPLAIDVDGYVGNDALVVTGTTAQTRNVIRRAADGSTQQIT
jgi:hypothetical protein